MRIHAGYVPYITICMIIGFHYLQRLRLSAARIFQNIRTPLHLGCTGRESDSTKRSALWLDGLILFL